jgi:hypothetical protein
VWFADVRIKALLAPPASQRERRRIGYASMVAGRLPGASIPGPYRQEVTGHAAGPPLPLPLVEHSRNGDAADPVTLTFSELAARSGLLANLSSATS